MYTPPESRSNFEDVGRFHEKFGLHNASNIGDQGPRPEASPEMRQFRANFLLEEVAEYVEAIGGKVEISELVVAGARSITVTVPEDAEIDHGKAFDALIDMVYVALGTAHLEGYPWQKGWDMVQRANMLKQRAQSADESKRGSALDVVKPEGWTAPNIDALLTVFDFPTELNNHLQKDLAK